MKTVTAYSSIADIKNMQGLNGSAISAVVVEMRALAHQMAGMNDAITGSYSVRGMYARLEQLSSEWRSAGGTIKACNSWAFEETEYLCLIKYLPAMWDYLHWYIVKAVTDISRDWNKEINAIDGYKDVMEGLLVRGAQAYNDFQLSKPWYAQLGKVARGVAIAGAVVLGAIVIIKVAPIVANLTGKRRVLRKA